MVMKVLTKQKQPRMANVEKSKRIARAKAGEKVRNLKKK